jgi:hypothetical protein
MARANDKCLGISKKSFKVGKPNSFFIFGEDIAIVPPAAFPNVYLTSSSHIWSTVTATREHDDAIKVEVRCLKKKKSRAVAPVNGDGTDDLTVTLVFDEGQEGEVAIECCFEDVDYGG